jgi:hypothetical protein
VPLYRSRTPPATISASSNILRRRSSQETSSAPRRPFRVRHRQDETESEGAWALLESWWP